jgi:uncharacterized repeat protein (TIGR01451 family)
VAMVPPGHEFVRLTPDRLVAPVGSEIMLKAGLVSEDGNLHPGERIEWAVARNGVGQFTDMGLRNAGQLYASLEAPQKVDDWSAVGRTAFLPVSFGDGLFISDADVQIRRGESWVTLTSCAEGTSQVTAFAPELCQFNQATTSIYWIDAQWTFPASVVAECGRPHVLTTTVFRRTNGTPLAGWVVRYTVGSGGSLGYEGGNTVDARTDAMGRASVEVSPSEGGGVTNVGISIVRPQSVGPNAMPQFELARGAATITWRGNVGAVGTVAPAAPLAPALPAAPVDPAPFSPPPASPVQTPAPYLPPTLPAQPSNPPSQPPPATSNSTQPSPYTPPPAGRVRLELTLKPTSAEQVAVGQNVGYELTITNRGDGVARHIEVDVPFDAGLSHLSDTLKVHEVKLKNGIRDLAPNDSEKVRLDFQLVASGRQCFEVKVTANGADLVQQQACCTGIQAALEVKITGLLRGVVGEVAEFNVAIRNTGSSGAAGVELRVQFDQAIEPLIDNGVERLPDGSVAVRLDRELAANEKRVFRLKGRCQDASAHACAKATVTAAGGANSYDEACLEILPTISAAPGTGAP